MRLRQMKTNFLAIQPKKQAGARAHGLFSAILNRSISFAVDVSVEKICTNVDAQLRIFLRIPLSIFL